MPKMFNKVWDAREMSERCLIYVWDMNELCIWYFWALPWDFQKIDMLETVWDMPDMCILDWDLPEACLIYVRDILEISLRNVRHMSYVWDMIKIYMRYAWDTCLTLLLLSVIC